MDGFDRASSGPLGLSVADGVARLTINRPDKKNALTQAMWDEVAELAETAARRARVLVIAGAGRDFSAGADIAEFSALRQDGTPLVERKPETPAAFAAIRNCSVPTIAAIRGICFGGGFGLAAACDIRVASPDASFAVPAARLGLAYPVDAMRDIVHGCGPQIARWLAFTGRAMDAKRALECGFLAELVPAEELDQHVQALAATIAHNAPLSIAASKAAISAVLSGATADRTRAEQAATTALESADYAEGRAAFGDRRKPVFRGS